MTDAGTAGPAKIASIGLKVSRGFTWHGVAVNGSMDLEPFTRIDPCGYPGQVMTDVAREARHRAPADLEDLARRLGCSLVQAIETGGRAGNRTADREKAIEG